MRLRKMHRLSIPLLFVFVVSLLPLEVSGTTVAKRGFEDAFGLMYASEAILLDEADPESASRAAGFMSVSAQETDQGIADAALVKQINATKAARNDLEATCSKLAELYAGEDTTCELERVNAYCQAEREKLTRRLSLFRKLRGDRRKMFTRMWHSIKRSGADFWRRIGPAGRRFLGRLGPEVLEMVKSGTATGAALRHLIKHHVRAIAREEVRKLILKGAQRLILGQAAIARAAGVAACVEQEQASKPVEQENDEDVQQTQETYGILAIDGILPNGFASMEWDGFIPGCIRHQASNRGEVDFHFVYDLDASTFTGSASGDAHAQELGWEGSGAFVLEGVEGTVEQDPDGSGWKFQGQGAVQLDYRMRASCPDGSGGFYPADVSKSSGGPVEIHGDLSIVNTTWSWQLYGLFESDGQQFFLTCGDCEVGTWSP
jgi:hypothetical protein